MQFQILLLTSLVSFATAQVVLVTSPASTTPFASSPVVPAFVPIGAPPLLQPAVRAFSCGSCTPPKFHNKEFYLPFCSEDKEGKKTTHPNLCGAICAEKYTKGSCDGCELKCSAVFSPVCSKDQKKLFANACNAECAGLTKEDFGPCAGGGFVIPGQTKLPPHAPTIKPKPGQNPDELQEVDTDKKQEEDV